jgi:hypothetical protein
VEAYSRQALPLGSTMVVSVSSAPTFT